MSPFNPIHQQRTVRDDESLTATQQHILLVATLRTDNNTGRVRCSQEILANDAKVSHATVERVLRAPAVRRYFIREREGRRLNLTWRNPSLSTEYPSLSTSETPHSEGPSTRASTPTSTRTGAPKVDAPLVSANYVDANDVEVFLDGGMEVVFCNRCRWFRDSCACTKMSE